MGIKATFLSLAECLVHTNRAFGVLRVLFFSAIKHMDVRCKRLCKKHTKIYRHLPKNGKAGLSFNIEKLKEKTP